MSSTTIIESEEYELIRQTDNWSNKEWFNRLKRRQWIIEKWLWKDMERQWINDNIEWDYESEQIRWHKQNKEINIDIELIEIRDWWIT